MTKKPFAAYSPVVALWKGARTYGRLLIGFSEDEVLELEAQVFGDAG